MFCQAVFDHKITLWHIFFTSIQKFLLVLFVNLKKKFNISAQKKLIKGK